MQHYHTRVAQLSELLTSYKYPLPLSEHLKQYFRAHKNAGSKDRREIRALGYAYFRIANALDNKDFENIAAMAAKFLDHHDSIQNFVNETEGFHIENLFPFNEYISQIFKVPEFQLSFLNQPAVWIKLKPGKETEVLAELKSENIIFNKYSDQILSFENELKLTDLKSFKNGFFRVQDLSSQLVSEHYHASEGETWWDCCAGAGGKSLALLEDNPGIKLYASDIRESILNNLHERHGQAGNRNINIFAADLSKPVINQKLPEFDGIIVDAPCSGSGTWARNPENLYYFDPETIKEYQSRQIGILQNVFPLKNGKPLIYITCSVFKAENEEVISSFTKEYEVKTEEQKYLEGYKNGAENMFICRMIKTE